MLKSITMNNYQDIIPYLKEKETFLYGAGATGVKFFDLLQKWGVPIFGFVDDDPNKHGTFVCGKRVFSFQELDAKANETEINVVLSSIYGNVLLRKLNGISAAIYEAFEIYEIQYKEELHKTLSIKMNRSLWLDKIYTIKQAVCDIMSGEILDVYADYVRKGDFSYQKIARIASDEDHYFIHQIKSAIRKEISILDCGAYIGDMLWQLDANKIPVCKLYACEANPWLYGKLKENILRIGWEKFVIPMNVALWDESTSLSFCVDKKNSSAGRVATEGVRVRAERIDDIIGEKIDYIKMDIEGAELPALRGAQKTIIANRPLLAISIYHSLDDIVNIPVYLMELVSDYYWIIRHHSMIYAETVLYGIPNEKIFS